MFVFVNLMDSADAMGMLGDDNRRPERFDFRRDIMKAKTILSGLLSIMALHAVAAADGGALSTRKGFSATRCLHDADVRDDAAAGSCSKRRKEAARARAALEDTGASFQYSGKCAYRFAEGQAPHVSLNVRSGQLTDICLPAGWRFQTTATTNNMNWQFSSPPAIDNMMLMRPVGPDGAAATVWIFAARPDGKVQKLTVDVRMTR